MPVGDLSALDQIVIVLDQPKDLVNIAGVIRAMMNMGLTRLRVVRPDEFDGWRIGGIAHRSAAIVEATEHFDDLASAVADATYVVGTSARGRTAGRNYLRPRDAGPIVVERSQAGLVAVVFGREDRGLTNEALDLCHAVITIPTAPSYPSLNLAQACLLVLYETFLAAEEKGAAQAKTPPKGKRYLGPATAEDLEEMYRVLEAGLDRVEFFKAREPRAVLRTLRTILGRAEPDLRESRLIRAIGFEIQKYLDQVEGPRTTPPPRKNPRPRKDASDE